MEIVKASEHAYCASSTDPFIQEFIDKYGAKEILEAGMVLLDSQNERDIDSLGDAAVFLCETIGCKKCPVEKQDFDLRVTEADKDWMMCCVNLYEWMIEKALEEAKKRLDEYRRTKVYEPIESEKEE